MSITYAGIRVYLLFFLTLFFDFFTRLTPDPAWYLRNSDHYQPLPRFLSKQSPPHRMAVSRQMQSPPKPGLVDGTRQASTFGVGISFMVFIFMVMLLRVWVRVVVLRALGTDDSMY